jgi:HTH-type transcriptional regulator/antitoxin HigA
MIGDEMITNDYEHAAAMRDIEKLWDSEKGTPDGDRFMELVIAVEEYEKKRWPIRNEKNG